MMQNIFVQTATLNHLQSIPGIELAAATLFSEADLPQDLRYKTTCMEDLYAAHDDGRLWVAVTEDSAVVGYATADVLDDQAHLSEIDVLPAFGRRGIGTRLVQTVIDWSRNAQFTSLSLITFRHLAWNAPFYAKLGFSFIDKADLGTDILAMFNEERRAGLNIANRVAMRLAIEKT